MEIKRHTNRLDFYIQKSLYSEPVIYKCFYWYGADYEVDITDHSTDTFCVRIQSKQDLNDPEAIVTKVKRDLADFKLREIVQEETRTIRELLVAKAFAYYDSEEEQYPDTEISDPVGFDPLSIRP